MKTNEGPQQTHSNTKTETQDVQKNTIRRHEHGGINL